jgi:hypothetical protein
MGENTERQIWTAASTGWPVSCRSSPSRPTAGWPSFRPFRRVKGIRTRRAYSASKAGLVALVKTAAKEVAPYGVTVNSIAPSMMKTRLLQDLSPERNAQLLAKVPMGRVGLPEEFSRSGNLAAIHRGKLHDRPDTGPQRRPQYRVSRRGRSRPHLQTDRKHRSSSFRWEARLRSSQQAGPLPDTTSPGSADAPW